MREKLNENPLLQVAVVGVLLLLAGVFALTSMGGGGGEEESTATTSATISSPSGSATVTATVTTATPEAAAATGAPAAPLPAPPLPRPVTAAFAANRTVVLLVVKSGGVDDALTATGALPLAFRDSVSLFVVPARKIARYAAITQGVDVNRVPALVVVRPRNLGPSRTTAIASVHYGFQSPQNIEQAVVDARYEGRTLAYHP
jgi:hypothetical protein